MQYIRVIVLLACWFMNLGALGVKHKLLPLPVTAVTSPMTPGLCNEWLNADGSNQLDWFGLYDVNYASLPKLNKVVVDLATKLDVAKPYTMVVPGNLLVKLLCQLAPVPEIWRAGIFSLALAPNLSVLVIGDTLLEELEQEEIEALIARELVHIGSYNDLKLAVFTALVITAAVWAINPADWHCYNPINAIPFIGDVRLSDASVKVMGFAALWILAVTLRLRSMNYHADAAAATVTEKPLVLANALAKKSTLWWRNNFASWYMSLWFPSPRMISRVDTLRALQRALDAQKQAAMVPVVPVAQDVSPVQQQDEQNKDIKIPVVSTGQDQLQ